MKKLSLLSRILLAVGALVLLAMLKVPIWEIYLTAPQYPEGLTMHIWHNTLTGDVKVISALNHYIGMRPITVEMFPEFKILRTLIMAASGVCLVLALIGRMWSAITYYLLLALADSAAMYDFWQWGYDYGHNLNPDAAIIIPGMAYQPPLIGYKKLLNFEAWSVPDVGGWILMVVTALSFCVVVGEWWLARRRRLGSVAMPHNQPTPNATTAMLVAVIGGLLFLPACSSGGPQPLRYGQDACEHCKMTLMDQHYGAEFITKKGKVYKFDDLNCLAIFLKEGTLPADQISETYVVDYAHPATFMPIGAALFLKSEGLKTPMASGVAAFAQGEELDKVKGGLGGEMWHWEAVLEAF